MEATGLASSTLAGLLGVGGVIVIVPLLFNVFPLFGIPEAVQMKVAVATSLATILPTSIQSARKHSATEAMDILTDRVPEGAPRTALGFGIGSVSAMMGIGGGTLGVPLLSLLGYLIRAAVATASAFGVIIAIPATIGRIWGGWSYPRVPRFSFGYISLIGFALIAPTSIIRTPWGVKLAHSIPPLVLTRAFAVFLAITSARMFWSIFT
ncbi:MAG: sulfite exporter TauE/SafE family protein [Alphaproteobacteria bacterium]|nr:sulfite exporter TauE/SafE family protein [Alphaproteobacteria bacterium]